MSKSEAPVVRPARHDEVAVLQKLELDAARLYGVLPETAFCLDLPGRDEDEHEQVRRRGAALVAEVAGTVVGFALALPVDGRAHLLELAVARARQGRGHGRLLLAAFEGWGRTAGLAEATLTTFRDVPWNAPFYERLGYRMFEVGPDRPELLAIREEERAAGFDRAPRVAMRKPLAGPPE